MDVDYKFQLIRTTNKRVLKAQTSGFSSSTLDCLFELNPTFTDRNDTGAR